MTLNRSTSGTNNGGTVYFNASSTTLGGSSSASLSSNGATSGTSNGGYVYFYPGTSNPTLGNAAGQFALSATSGSTGGNGGTITTFVSSGTMTVKSGAANVSVLGANGNGGTITLNANPTVTFSGTSLTLSANGGSTSGNGGQIHILGQGTMTVGTGSNAVALSATAPGSGNGGTIEVGYYTTLTINTAQLLVSSSGTNGNGGTINLHDLGTISLTGNVTANGAGTGNGGSITITQTSVNPLTISSSELIADSGSTGGNGGSLTITSNGTLTITGSSISVTASSSGNGNGGTIVATGNEITLDGTLTANGEGTGDGGNITLDVTGTTPLDLTEGQQIIAKGGSGSMTNGGSVTLPNVGDYNQGDVIDIYPDGQSFSADLRKLTAKAKLHPNAVIFQATGAIQHQNLVPCQAYLVTGGANAWPQLFWDCANPFSLSTTDQVAANWIASASTLSGSLLNTLFPDPQETGYSTTGIYVYNDSTDFNLMWKKSAASSAGSASYSYNDNNGNLWVYLAIFENVTGPSGSYLQNTSQISANTAHELGHVLDFRSAGGDYWSTDSTYVNVYLVNDATKLNADDGINLYDQGAGTAPCSKNNTAPFDGQPGATGSVVNDQTGKTICYEAGGNLNSGSGSNNSAIAANASSGVIGSGPSEIFAEAFGWNAYGKTIAGPNYNSSFFQLTADGLFLNGYYACAVAWANYALTGTASYPSYCGGQ